MKNRKILKKGVLILIFTSFYLYNCRESSTTITQKEETPKLSIGNPIDSFCHLVDSSIFPVSKCNYNHTTLRIELKLPVCEIYYETKMDIIRERVVLLAENQFPDLDSLLINFDVSKSQQPNEFLVLYDKKHIAKVKQFNLANKMYNDFNNYILKNIDGNKLAQFSVYLKILRKVDPKALRTDDFIELIYQYIDEVQQKPGLEDNQNILKALKKLITDGGEWKDFNPNDIDYFLNYKQ